MFYCEGLAPATPQSKKQTANTIFWKSNVTQGQQRHKWKSKKTKVKKQPARFPNALLKRKKQNTKQSVQWKNVMSKI